MKISQLPYQRPDKEKTLKELYNLLDEFKECKNGAEQYSVIGKIDKIIEKTNSMGALAYVRFTLDTNDEFYINERRFLTSSALSSMCTCKNSVSRCLIRRTERSFSHIFRP